MTTLPLRPQPRSEAAVPAFLSQLWQTSRFFSVAILLFIALIPISMIGVGVVSAEIDNSRIWIKPLKFSMSIAFYSITLLWMLSLITKWPRVRTFIAVFVGANLLYEIAWTVIQAIRGVRSHFNNATTFDSLWFGTIGLSITMVMLLNVLVIILLLTERMKDKPLQWALVFGLITTTVGGFTAVPMTMPSATQMAALERGEQLDVIGAHSVGVEDGGPGLPFLGWSTEGGDLRVNHFVGLHGLQLIPLLAVLINRRWRHTLSSRRRSLLVATSGLGYIGLTLLLMWQALRGQSVIAPDATTLTAFAILFGTIAAISALIVNVGTKRQPKMQAAL